MSRPSVIGQLVKAARAPRNSISSSPAASSSRRVSSTPSTSATEASIQRPTTDSDAPAILSFPNTPPLPHTSNHTATLTLHAHHPYPLDLYTQFAYHTAQSLKIPTTRPAFLPTTKSLFTVLKSPFVHKKAQENFEKRTHRRVLKVYDTEKEVLDLWLRYLKRNSIGGVGMKAQVWETVEFGYSSQEGEMMAQAQGSLNSEKRSEEEIEKAAKALMEDLTQEGGSGGAKLDKAVESAAASSGSSA